MLLPSRLRPRMQARWPGLPSQGVLYQLWPPRRRLCCLELCALKCDAAFCNMNLSDSAPIVMCREAIRWTPAGLPGVPIRQGFKWLPRPLQPQVLSENLYRPRQHLKLHRLNMPSDDFSIGMHREMI